MIPNSWTWFKTLMPIFGTGCETTRQERFIQKRGNRSAIYFCFNGNPWFCSSDSNGVAGSGGISADLWSMKTATSCIVLQAEQGAVSLLPRHHVNYHVLHLVVLAAFTGELRPNPCCLPWNHSANISPTGCAEMSPERAALTIFPSTQL